MRTLAKDYPPDPNDEIIWTHVSTGQGIDDEGEIIEQKIITEENLPIEDVQETIIDQNKGTRAKARHHQGESQNNRNPLRKAKTHET